MTLKINQNTSLENVTLYQHSECHSLQKLLSGHKDRRKQTKEKKNRYHLHLQTHQEAHNEPHDQSNYNIHTVGIYKGRKQQS